MSGWDAGSAGIDPERVAELLVDLGGPRPGRRGSGYRVSASAVLTAAHVVRDAVRVRVRFSADRPNEWMTEGTVAWSDASVDAAVITITPRPQDEGELAPIAFGRVAERDAVLTCSAMGFPRFKLRNDPGRQLDDGSPSQYRDSAHAVGTIAVLANRREGTLEVSVPMPERDPEPERSPWEGMSGAAVWSAGRIIGLVAEHHRADGLGRLAATRVDRWYERLPPTELEELCRLTSLPAQWDQLSETVPSTASELLEAGYIAQVRDIAPDQLLGREQELAELVQFCAGQEHYQWWQAGPWAGKSALAAWHVLHPPAGVSVVSFLVTGRLAGQADSDAFTEAMVEQLAAVASAIVPEATTPAGRDRERRRLLDQAASRVGEWQGRLLLVVDGLDEDEGARPGSGKPSIASLLPRRPPDSVRVLVFSRPHPGIPSDVPGDHPLRRCVPGQLAPSPFAHDIEIDAKDELMERLHGDRLQVDILGLITAAGGGLTLRELAELSGEPEWSLGGKLGSVFGRSLKTRAPSQPPSAGQPDRVYLFAHETLRTMAEQELARDLGPYRQRINTWADTYREQGWPDSTPRYLLRPYGRMLANSEDLQRLLALATDPERHDRMLAYTYGDAAALAEITTSQRLLLAQPFPDLAALGRLAIYRERLANRNRAVRSELPALWVRLGQPQRGEALARGITDSSAQAYALSAVAEGLAKAGQWDRAEQTARSITSLALRAEALTQVAQALAEVNRDRAVALATEAEQIAHRITDPDLHVDAQALRQAVRTVVAKALAAVGEWDRAEQIARSITRLNYRAEGLSGVAQALAEVDHDRAVALATDAEQTISSITDPGSHGQTLRAVAEALATVGQRDRAVALATEAEQIAHRNTDPEAQAWRLQTVVQILAIVGQWDRAEQIARSIANLALRAEALTQVAEALAEVNHDRAIALATEAEQTAHRITDPSVRARTQSAVVQALGEIDRDRAVALATEAEQTTRSITSLALRAGTLTAISQVLAGVDYDRAVALATDAERATRNVTNPTAHAEALTAVVQALAEVNQDRAVALATDAKQIAHSITGLDLGIHTHAVRVEVAKALAAVGEWDRAEQIARSIASPSHRVWTLMDLAQALAEVDHDRAVALATDAEQTARSITDLKAQAEALRTVVEALAVTRQWDHAEQIARSITDPFSQASALTTVAKGLAKAEQWGHAEQTARSITNLALRAEALTALVEAVARVDRDHALALAGEAEQTARSITRLDYRAEGLSAAAQVLAEVDRDRAIALATDAEQIAHRITDPEAQARALSAVVEALADIGQLDHAEQIAHSITEPSLRAWALSEVAHALAEVDHDRAIALATDAEQTAQSITDPMVQAGAYLAVVRALSAPSTWDRAARGEVRRIHAYRLLASILAGENWLQAVEVLGKLHPPAVEAISEALPALNDEPVQTTQ
jgi:hypothetical protein